MGSSVTRPEPDAAAQLKESMESSCAEAARLIQQADVFLLLTGAGFSADSGLAIYADVAKVEAYKQRELEYHDICEPHWLDSEPDLFWGFWGQCFNDYRTTAPHPGYEIIERWVESRFRHSETAAAIRARLASPPAAPGPSFEDQVEAMTGSPVDREEPYVVTDHAGAFFVFTSNVDAHHFDWFRACEIRECHGNTEVYQCSTRACPSGIWRAPLDFHYTVEKDTMLAPATAAAAAPEEPASAGVGADEAPRIGRTSGEARATTLRHMPGTAPASGAPGFQTNHPTCPRCGQPARPAILMFGDQLWRDIESQHKRWMAWNSAVEAEAKERAKAGSPLRVAILEIGAGANVTTVRNSSERSLLFWTDAGAEVTFVRVNPDYPHGDKEQYAPGGAKASSVIPVMARGLETIRRIDAALGAM